VDAEKSSLIPGKKKQEDKKKMEDVIEYPDLSSIMNTQLSEIMPHVEQSFKKKLQSMGSSASKKRKTTTTGNPTLPLASIRRSLNSWDIQTIRYFLSSILLLENKYNESSFINTDDILQIVQRYVRTNDKIELIHLVNITLGRVASGPSELIQAVKSCLEFSTAL
jgi:hypothetical protein